jgi:hypothetical protein
VNIINLLIGDVFRKGVDQVMARVVRQILPA